MVALRVPRRFKDFSSESSKASFSMLDGDVANAKNECRDELIAAVRTKPKRIFTLGGPELLDVQRFREKWGNDPYIVSVERDAKTAEFVQTGRYCVELLVGTIHNYCQIGGPKMHRLALRPSKSTKNQQMTVTEIANDFIPVAYDLAFLDYTGFPTDDLIAVTKTFMTDHVERDSVIGVTFCFNKLFGWAVDTLADNIAQATNTTCETARSYQTKSDMAFMIFRK